MLLPSEPSPRTRSRGVKEIPYARPRRHHGPGVRISRKSDERLRPRSSCPIADRLIRSTMTTACHSRLLPAIRRDPALPRSNPQSRALRTRDSRSLAQDLPSTPPELEQRRTNPGKGPQEKPVRSPCGPTSSPTRSYSRGPCRPSRQARPRGRSAPATNRAPPCRRDTRLCWEIPGCSECCTSNTPGGRGKTKRRRRKDRG